MLKQKFRDERDLERDEEEEKNKSLFITIFKKHLNNLGNV